MIHIWRHRPTLAQRAGTKDIERQIDWLSWWNRPQTSTFLGDSHYDASGWLERRPRVIPCSPRLPTDFPDPRWLATHPISRRQFLGGSLALAATIAAHWSRPRVGYAAWSAPLGIPDPTWGIETPVMPSLPSPWDSDTTSGFYYVKQGGTNANNGKPADPRGTIPSPIPAGAVVVMDNTATWTSAFNITFDGSSGSPSFLVGASLSRVSMANITINADSTVKGTYGVIEFLDFFYNIADGMFWGQGANAEHISMRHCDYGGDGSGTITHAAMQWARFSGATTRNHLVCYDVTFHDIGAVNVASDIDAHALKVDTDTANGWVVDCTFDAIGGDSVQMGPQGAGAEGDWTCNHIYMGRCTTQGNRQSGGWVKHARDIVFSQNTISNMNGSTFDTGTPGTGLGMQEGSDRVWYLFNHIYDVIDPNGQSGINILQALSVGLSEGTEIYAIGNVIHDITATDGIGIMTQPLVSDAIYLVNNTIYGATAGIYWRNNAPKVHYWNNLIDNVLGSGNHMLFDNAALPSGSTIRYNDFGKTGVDCSVTWTGAAGSPYTTIAAWQSAMSAATNNLNVDPTYTSVASDNYKLLEGSRGIDEGNPTESPAYARFETLYSLDIRKDFNGLTRPLNIIYDIGAFEFGMATTAGRYRLRRR